MKASIEVLYDRITTITTACFKIKQFKHNRNYHIVESLIGKYLEVRSLSRFGVEYAIYILKCRRKNKVVKKKIKSLLSDRP